MHEVNVYPTQDTSRIEIAKVNQKEYQHIRIITKITETFGKKEHGSKLKNLKYALTWGCWHWSQWQLKYIGVNNIMEYGYYEYNKDRLFHLCYIVKLDWIAVVDKWICFR